MKIVLSDEEFRSLAEALLLSTTFDAVSGMVKDQVPDALMKVMRDGDIRVCDTCGEWSVMQGPGVTMCSDCVASGIFS